MFELKRRSSAEESLRSTPPTQIPDLFLFRSRRIQKDRGPRSIHTSARQEAFRRTLQAGLVFIVLCCGVAFVGRLVLALRIQSVSCSLDEQPCAPALYDAAQSLRGRFIFTNLPAPFVGYDFKLTRVFPSTVHVNATTPLPVVVVQTLTNEKVMLTAEGYVLPTSQQDDVLPIIYDERLTKDAVGNRLDTARVDFYKELKGAWTSQLDSKVIEIRVQKDDSIILMLTGGSSATMKAESIGSQLRTLQSILIEPTIEVRDKIIDLRFRSPVIAPAN